MSNTNFADVVHQALIFSDSDPADQLIVELLNCKWVQRLRDISQTANTRLVYMFSEHSRFGHSLGVAYLANQITKKLLEYNQKEVNEWRVAVAGAALLHDIGHMAPGSHTAYRTWFSQAQDIHETFATKIIKSDLEILEILNKYNDQLAEKICLILSESNQVPAWTWQIISGGGWNVDRGNWCIADSILAGVSYGKYNIPALTDSLVLTNNGQLALGENRLDAMMHFALSRHAMYRQVYQHRVLLAADTLNRAIADRARHLYKNQPERLGFCDNAMQEVLANTNPANLTLECIFQMREPWWRYHISCWANSKDSILSDLTNRLLYRRLFKTVRIQSTDNEDQLFQLANKAVTDAGFDPEYYLHKVQTSDMHDSDYKHAMNVLMDSGILAPLPEAEPLFAAMARESKLAYKRWFVMPAEAKKVLGRNR